MYLLELPALALTRFGRELPSPKELGEAASRMPLTFQAFYKTRPVGPTTTILLERGDAYILSSKAVGADWKCSSVVTWRHVIGDVIACSHVEERKRRRER